MSKGIAVVFKEKYGRPEGTYHIGDIAVIKSEDKTIVYLVTKFRYWQKPRLQDLETCLRKLAALGLTSISIPRIGCGLDRLSWTDVSEMIKTELSDVHVTVYSL